MALTMQSPDVQCLCTKLREYISPYAGRVEYGNLRSQVSDFEDCSNGECVTNVALVYETPGGSTDQINISYHHSVRQFSVVDEQDGEVFTDCLEFVFQSIEPRISGIPSKRLETLYAEIRRLIDEGTNTAGLFGHLNRILQSEFKGGGITHLELRDAMTYAVQYMNSRKGN